MKVIINCKVTVKRQGNYFVAEGQFGGPVKFRTKSRSASRARGRVVASMKRYIGIIAR